MGAAGRRFAARSCLWLLPANRRVLQRGRDATRDSPGAIIPNSGCLREPSDMHVGLQGSWYQTERAFGEQHGRALFCFFRIRPWQPSCGGERGNKARKKKKLC
ncbi:hypothetical protein LI328DRAFT_98480 [Trichoderma asperelloides]|nr:hypothetical protein LI328DRAFT_98480 [Trichoderma asperelloides]